MEEELRLYGLSENEIAIYLAGIKIGEGTIQRISEVSGIGRTTAYDVLESLKKKGLAYSLEKQKKLHYAFNEPKVLKGLLQEKIRVIERVIPDLSKLFKSVVEKPKIELYEGLTSMKQAFEELLKEKELLAYGAGLRADEVLGHYTSNFAKRRVEKKIVLKAIVEERVPTHMLESDVRKYTQVKRLSLFKDHKCTYFIYGNKLLILFLGEEKFVVKITSPILVESQRIIFNWLWEISKA